MTVEEAIKRCEFWTTVHSAALGSTEDAEVGHFFGGEEYPMEQFSAKLGRFGWAIKVPRVINDGDVPMINPTFARIVEEIERRRA